MDMWITADGVFDGKVLLANHALRIKDQQVVDITPRTAGMAAAQHLQGVVSPGFVDLQVNGGGGVMLNSTPTAAGIATILKAHRRFGTVAVMVTVITDHPDVLEQAADAVIAAYGAQGVLGLHIEGPHIAVSRRGTHAAAYVRPMDKRTLDIVARLRQNRIPVMITVAPESTTSDQIAALAQMGAIVSLGHTDCTAADINAAIKAGARCGTHLFNAMSPMLGRAPGAVGALINSDCYTGIICDGHHVADDMVAMAVRARPVPDRMFLVSDAMATVGGPDTFDLYGKAVTLKGGRLINGEGSLAGAHITQADGLHRLIAKCGVPAETALRMAISNPATCLGVPETGQIENRSIDDLVVLDGAYNLKGLLADHLQSVVTANVAE